MSGTGAEAGGQKGLEAETPPRCGVRLAHRYFSAIGEVPRVRGAGGRRSQAPQGARLAGGSEGPGQTLSTLPPSALPNAVTVPSHLSGQQQPRSVPSSNSESRPSPPQLPPSLGFGRFSRGWVGRRGPQVRPFPLHLPLPRPLGLVLKDLPLALAQSGSRLRAGATTSDGRGCFPPCPPFKGRAHTRWAGPHWLAPGGLLG